MLINDIIPDYQSVVCGMNLRRLFTISWSSVQYLQKRNIYNEMAAGYVHWRICKHYHLPAPDKLSEQKPERVTENERATILWHMPVKKDI